MKKNLLMTTALVATISSANVVAADLNISEDMNVIQNVETDENGIITNFGSFNNIIKSDDGNINISAGTINTKSQSAAIEHSGNGDINIYGSATINGKNVEGLLPDTDAEGEYYKTHGNTIVHIGNGNINISGGKLNLTDAGMFKLGGCDAGYGNNCPDGGEDVTGDINISGGEHNFNASENYSSNSINITGGSIIMTNESTLEAGDDRTSVANDSNILIQNATIKMTNSDIEATGNINLKNADISSSTTYEDDMYGIYALGNVEIDGGNTELNNSYITADGSLNFNNANYKAIDSDATTRGTIVINNGTITNQNADLETFQNINISGGTLDLTDSSDLTALEGIEITGGTINVDDGEIWSLGDINLKGGNINLTNRSTINTLPENMDEIFNNISAPTDGNINIDGAKVSLSDSGLMTLGDLTIKSGSLNIINNDSTNIDNREEMYQVVGSTNVTGGTLSLSDVEATSDSINISGGEVVLGNNVDFTNDNLSSTFTLTGGKITMNGSENVIGTNHGDGYDITSGKFIMNGGSIDVNGKGTNYIEGGNISVSGGNINIAQNSTLTSVATITADEQIDKISTIKLTDTGTINLSGKLNSHIDGNGLVNIKTSSALIDGDINGSNITFEADHALSKAISGTIGELSSLNVKKGTLTFDKKVANIGNLNIDGGLDIGLNNVTVSGDAIFNSGSKLSLEIADADKYGSLSADSITAKDGSKLALNVTKQMAIDEEISGLKLLDAPTIDNKFTNELSNARYEVSNDKGTYTIKYVASASDVVADAGGSSNNAGTAEAWDAIISAPAVSETAKAVANVLNELSKAATTSEGKKAYVDALTAIAPDAAPSVQQTQSETANQVFGAVGSRLSGGSVSQSGGGRGVSSNSGGRGMGGAHGGRGGHGGKGGHGRSHGGRGMSSGDTMYQQTAVWMQGLFNKAELEDTSKSKGFDSETSGVALGIENFINEDVKVGIGYAYNHTDIDGFMRSTDVDTHTAIAYGEYKPSNWFINAVATYGWSDYEENKNVAGSTVKAKYDAESFGLQAMTGYEFGANGYSLTPETGLRYVHIKQDGYKDTADQKVSGGQSDILTGVIGAKLSKNWELDNGMNLRPEIRVAATYDLVNDDAGSVVTLANGSAYNVSGEALDEFGMEFGAGLTAEVNDNIELSLGYEGKFKKDYQDHSGLINAKYKF